MPTILLKKSDTPGSVPGTANLTNLAGGVEVAVNTADKRVYSMTSASAVIELGTNPSSLTCADASFTLLKAASASITNLTATSLVLSNLSIASANITTLTSASATITNLIATSASITTLTNNPTFGAGTASGVAYLNGSKVLTSGTALVFDGTNLGIGTASPGAKLAIAQTSNAITQGLLLINAAGTQNGGWYHGGSALIGREGGFDTIALAAGNVGIGTASPDNKLEVAVGDNAGINIEQTGANQTGFLNFRDSDGGLDGRISYDHSNNSLRFATSVTERMRLTSSVLSTDSSIDVGIGTASPGAPLHVSYTGQAGLRLSNTSGTPSDWYLQTLNGGVLRWYSYTASTERMQIDGSGNLGLGVTPSAWSSSARALQISGFSSVGQQDTGSFIAGFNFYQSATGFRYLSTNPVALYSARADGSHAFFTAPSGTAGNDISFGDAKMTIDASGNLGVGTTSPGNFSGTVKLVVGSAAATTTAGAVTVYSGTATYGGLYFADGTVGDQLYRGAVEYNHSTDALLLYSAGAERARITAGGYFKASNAGTYQGSTLAYHELRTDAADYSTIVGNTNASPYGAYILFGSADPNNSTNLFLLCNGWNGSSLATRATIRSNGGLANYQSNNVDLSDARTKKDIAPAASMWGKVAALEIVAYKYNDQTHDDVNLGVIAQQVEAVEPVWVDNDGFGETPEGEEPLKTVYTKDITFAAIKALQEAMARIEQLEADMAALKASA